MSMSAEATQATLNEITFEHHPTLFVALSCFGDAISWLQIRDSALPIEINSGRKWRLSPYMVKSEVVQTVWAAYEAWVIHEARESFHYKGVTIFGPHFDVDALVGIADQIEVR